MINLRKTISSPDLSILIQDPVLEKEVLKFSKDANVSIENIKENLKKMSLEERQEFLEDFFLLDYTF
jgi:chemotaxis protein CheY-P-specific phosphatase CheC